MVKINELIEKEKLRTGEEMDIFKVLQPEEKLKNTLLKFLRHKGPFWMTVLKDAFENKLGELKTYCYIGKLKDTLISNITVMRKNSRPIGLLTHVFTAEAHRGKEAASLISKAVVEDFVKEKGQAMYLQAEYEGPAWKIYTRCGFKDLGDKTGTMAFLESKDFLSSYFHKSASRVQELNWADLPGYCVLGTIEEGWFLRSVTYGTYGVEREFETKFYKLMEEIKERLIVDQRGLFSENGALVGLAFMKAEPRWNKQTCTLDFFLHPNFYEDGLKLISALKIPDEMKLQSFADSKSSERMRILEKCGFTKEAVLRGQIRDQLSPLDVIVYKK